MSMDREGHQVAVQNRIQALFVLLKVVDREPPEIHRQEPGLELVKGQYPP